MLRIKFYSAFVALLFVSQIVMAQTTGVNKQPTSSRIRSTVAANTGIAGTVGTTEVMTDKQIVNFIKEEQKKGTPNSEIIAKLLLKGVTEAQLIRVREDYLSSQGDALAIEEGEVKEHDGVPARLREKSQFAGLAYSVDSLDVVIPDSLGLVELKSRMHKQKEIFGHNMFANKNLVFEPNMNIATPEN